MPGASLCLLFFSPAFWDTFLEFEAPLLLPLSLLLLLLPALLLLLLPPEHLPGQLPSTFRLSVFDRRVEPGVGVLPLADVTLMVTCVPAAAANHQHQHQHSRHSRQHNNDNIPQTSVRQEGPQRTEENGAMPCMSITGPNSQKGTTSR